MRGSHKHQGHGIYVCAFPGMDTTYIINIIINIEHGIKFTINLIEHEIKFTINPRQLHSNYLNTSYTLHLFYV